MKEEREEGEETRVKLVMRCREINTHVDLVVINPRVCERRDTNSQELGENTSRDLDTERDRRVIEDEGCIETSKDVCYMKMLWNK